MTFKGIIIAGTLFFSLVVLGFVLTIVEFIKMKNKPHKYRNPRYKRK